MSARARLTASSRRFRVFGGLRPLRPSLPLRASVKRFGCGSAALRLYVKRKTRHFGTKMKNLKDSILTNQHLATLILGRSSHFECSKSRMHQRALQCTFTALAPFHGGSTCPTHGSKQSPGSLRNPRQPYATQNIAEDGGRAPTSGHRRPSCPPRRSCGPSACSEYFAVALRRLRTPYPTRSDPKIYIFFQPRCATPPAPFGDG